MVLKRVSLTILILLIMPFTLGGCIEYSFNRISVSKDGLIALALNEKGEYEPLLQGKTDVYVTDGRGSFLRKLTDNDNTKAWVQWAPNGKKLLYVEKSLIEIRDTVQTRSEERWTIYTVDAAGRHREQIIESENEILSPSFSPDGKKIAYYQHFEDEDLKHPSLYSVNLNTGKKELILKMEPPYALYDPFFSGIKWFSENQLLAIKVVQTAAQEVAFLGEIIEVNVRTREEKPLTKEIVFDTKVPLERSPDGKSILFTAIDSPTFPPPPDSHVQIYSFNLRDKSLKQLTDVKEEICCLSFSPDGKRIAFVQGEEGSTSDIYVMNASGRNLRKLTDGGNFTYPFWVSKDKLGYVEVYEYTEEGKEEKLEKYTLWIEDIARGGKIDLSEAIKRQWGRAEGKGVMLELNETLFGL